MSPQPVRYYSRVDGWLVALISASILLQFVLGLAMFLTGIPQAGGTMMLAGVFTAAVVLALTYPLYYEITPSDLFIRCGILIRQSIPLSAIQEVFPTRNPLSAPAMSLDRLRVNYTRNGHDRFVLISPRDKPGFTTELVRRAGTLELRGDRVLRSVY